MKTKRTDDALKLILFIILPFLSFLVSLKSISTKSSAIVFIVFCFLFGYSFNFEFESADSYRVANTFLYFDPTSLSDIYKQYIEGLSPDIYRWLIYAITKIFTDNPKFLYGIFGFVFGIFWYCSILKFEKERSQYKNTYILILFFIFLIINPITNVNGARFNTAIWVFFLSTLNFLYYGKARWAWGVIATPLIHFSFISIVPFVFLFYFMQNLFYTRNRVYSWVYAIFIMSFVLSWILELNSLQFDFLTDSTDFGSSISGKINRYNSYEMAVLYSVRASESAFLQVSHLFTDIKKIYFFALMIFVGRRLQFIDERKRNFNKLYAIILASFIFTYLASALIPSGGRFLVVSYLLSILLLLNLYKADPNKVAKYFIVLLIPVFSFNIAFNTGFLTFHLVDINLWYGNFFLIIADGLEFRYY